MGFGGVFGLVGGGGGVGGVGGGFCFGVLWLSKKKNGGNGQVSTGKARN